MKVINTTLAEMDLAAFRFDVPGSDDEWIQDVVYNNKITEAELRAYIARKYDMYPQDVEIAR